MSVKKTLIIKSVKTVFYNKNIREKALKQLDNYLYKRIVKKNSIKHYPDGAAEIMEKAPMALINSVIENVDKGYISPHVIDTLIGSLVTNAFLAKDNQKVIKAYEKKYGVKPPSLIVISPTQQCNLKCIGCYANSSSNASEKLDWNTLDKIINEKNELWGSYFTVISGGEPLLYESQGKSIIDLAQKYQSEFFLMYTNGTLIDKKMAKKLAEVGNITPAISVEGFGRETDTRRGIGVHTKVIEAMKNLREAGVPFGISFTATKDNAHLLNDTFIDYYFENHGAIYAWVFQLMPIGRANCLDLMVTPKQRLDMFRTTQRLIKDRKIFIADFWNSGCVTNGCISAGKSGSGYLYIEWNGNITPCVFNPYSPVNINDVYEKGGTLNNVLEDPFFRSIRKWQKDYSSNGISGEVGNWLIPCAIKDHYDVMEKILNKYHPKPIDEAANEALNDKQYKENLKRYGEKVAEVTTGVWKREYLKKQS